MKIQKIYKFTNIFFLIFFLYLFTIYLGYFLLRDFPDIYIIKKIGIATRMSHWHDFGWRKDVWNENGLIETIQALILFFTICYLFYFIKKFYKSLDIFVKVFLIIEIIGLSYFFLEEISWGQHLIKFDTPEFFINVNNQKEFNLHNISNLFNELPKGFVFIWCGLSALFLKYFKPKIKNIYYKIIMPNDKLIIISIVLLIVSVPDQIISKANLIDYSKMQTENGYNFKMLFTVLISFKFIRLSEFQEFLFCYYFLWHSIFLKEKLLKK